LKVVVDEALVLAAQLPRRQDTVCSLVRYLEGRDR